MGQNPGERTVFFGFVWMFNCFHLVFCPLCCFVPMCLALKFVRRVRKVLRKEDLGKVGKNRVQFERGEKAVYSVRCFLSSLYQTKDGFSSLSNTIPLHSYVWKGCNFPWLLA